MSLVYTSTKSVRSLVFCALKITGRRGNFDGLANSFGWAVPPYHNLLPTAHTSRQEAPPAAPAPAPRASTSSEYAQNYKEPPTKRSPFTCDFCSKGYTYKWNLECHLRDEHAKEFPFQCGKCRKGFFLQTDTQEVSSNLLFVSSLNE